MGREGGSTGEEATRPVFQDIRGMTRWDGLAGGRGKEGAWSIRIVTVVVEAKAKEAARWG